MSTITGRLGLTADKALDYVKGGAAWCKLQVERSILGIELASNDRQGSVGNDDRDWRRVRLRQQLVGEG